MAEPDRTGGAEDPPSGPNPTSVADGADTAAPAVSADDRTAPPDPPSTPDSHTDSRKAKRERQRGGLAFLRELPVLLLVAFLLALLIKTFLVQAFYIPSESMEPTLNVGDRVLVNKVSYHLH